MGWVTYQALSTLKTEICQPRPAAAPSLLAAGVGSPHSRSLLLNAI